MISLLIETSTERGCVALMREGRVLLKENLPFGYNNSKFLLPTIKASLEALEIAPKDLKMITVGIGPGSYTGIRVGAMTAKMMAYALKIPLVGICTLEGFLPSSDGPFAAVIDAKIGGIYFLIGEKKGDQINYLSKPDVCSLESFLEKSKEIKTLVTPNSAQLRSKLEALSPKIWSWQENELDPISITRAALHKLHQGMISKDYKLDLLYLRKTQAEIERQRD